MTRRRGVGLGALLLVVLAVPPLLADEPPGSARGSGHTYGEHGYLERPHGGAGHFLRHLLRHQKTIGLSEEQVGKIKALSLELDKTRIRTEAEIAILERELSDLIRDDKADLAAIEAKLRRMAELEVSLRLSAIKARREAVGVLTPEQREKAQAHHEERMKKGSEHRMKGMEGMGHGPTLGESPHAAPTP